MVFSRSSVLVVDGPTTGNQILALDDSETEHVDDFQDRKGMGSAHLSC